MEQRVKVVLAILAVISLVLAVGLYSTWNAKVQLEKEKEKLAQENDSLVSQVNDLNQRRQNLETRIQQLSQDLDKAMRDKEEFERRFRLSEKAKEELTVELKKLKEQKTITTTTYSPPVGTSSAEDAYWASVVKAKTEAELQLQNIRAELRDLQLSNEKLQRDKASLELEVANLTRERDELKRKIDYNQKLMDSLAQELVRDKNEKILTEESAKVIKNENAILRRQLNALNERKSGLERRLVELQDKNTSLEKRLKDMETLLQDSVAQMDSLKRQVVSTTGTEKKTTEEELEKKKEAVELPPIVVRPRLETQDAASTTAAQGLTGKILAINADNNFVVIDLGEDNGIQVGNTFKVWRDSKPIAHLEVIQVRRSISACDIKKEMAPIKVGDLVR